MHIYRDARITGEFNPTKHAAKALAVGTALCLGASGIAAFAIGRAMGVNSVSSLSLSHHASSRMLG